MVSLRGSKVESIPRGVVAIGFILSTLGSQIAIGQPATDPNICFQRYLMGAAPKQSSVQLQSEEMRSKIDGTDIGAKIGRGLVTGLMGLEYAVLYPPQKLIKKLNQRKYRWMSRVIYDAFDGRGPLPQLDYPYQVTPEYLRKYMRKGRALNMLYQEVLPYKYVHHLQDKDELKSLIQKASATGAMCPFGTAPSRHSLTAMINSGLLEKMVTKAEVEPNFWLLSTETLVPAKQDQQAVNPFEAIDTPDETMGEMTQLKGQQAAKPEMKPIDKKLRRLGKSLSYKAQKLQFTFDRSIPGPKVESPERIAWTEFKEVLDKIEELK